MWVSFNSGYYDSAIRVCKANCGINILFFPNSLRRRRLSSVEKALRSKCLTGQVFAHAEVDKITKTKINNERGLLLMK